MLLNTKRVESNSKKNQLEEEQKRNKINCSERLKEKKTPRKLYSRAQMESKI